MAACTAVVSQKPVVCIPCLGSDSPSVLVTGVINWQIDWEAVMLSDMQYQPTQAVHPDEHLAAVRQQLLDEFKRVTLETLVETAPHSRPTLAAVVQVSALDDHYIVSEEGQQLFDVLSEASMGPVEIVWLPGGHASCIVSSVASFVPAIRRAFELVECQDESLTHM